MIDNMQRNGSFHYNYTLKDGTKRKHRYYVCCDFQNRGSAACKASSVKTHEAEDAVIQKIVQFSSNMKKLSKHLQILVLVLLIR